LPGRQIPIDGVLYTTGPLTTVPPSITGAAVGGGSGAAVGGAWAVAPAAAIKPIAVARKNDLKVCSFFIFVA
jgi:hypothetical protein